MDSFSTEDSISYHSANMDPTQELKKECERALAASYTEDPYLTAKKFVGADLKVIEEMYLLMQKLNLESLHRNRIDLTSPVSTRYRNFARVLVELYDNEYSRRTESYYMLSFPRLVTMHGEILYSL